ncbi:MAG: hypothetical protein AAF149_15100 [Bacteroidota bacterium]
MDLVLGCLNQYYGDIYRSALDSNGDTSVQKVYELNSIFDEESLFLSSIGDYIIIQAWKTEFNLSMTYI